MKKQRPVNLDLGTLKFPPMAIASILHRVSGIVLFLLIPFLLYVLEQSLQSAESFMAMKHLLDNFFIKLVLWGFISATLYHLMAGIRHLLMDFGLGEEVSTGRKTALVVIELAVLLIILVGIWLW